MDELLFKDRDLSGLLQDQEAQMVSAVDQMPPNKLLNSNLEDLAEYFAEQFKIELLTLDESGIQAESGDAKIDVSRRFEYGYPDGGRAFVTGTSVKFFVPFSGNVDLLRYRPSTFTYNPPRASIASSDIVFTLQGTELDTPQFKAEFDRQLASLRDHVSWLTRDVSKFNTSLEAKARKRIEDRRQKLLRDQKLVENLGFPLKQRNDAPHTYAVPTQRRKIPKVPEASNAPFKPEPALDAAEYDHILSVMTNMVAVMERSPHAFKDMKEEDLRQHFLVQLNGHYEGQATGETFNFEGKTDILIRAEGKNIFIAECKFWEGPESLKSAIDQLLGYATWRDSKTAILVFNRNRNLSSVLEKIPTVVKAHPTFKRQLNYAAQTGFRFVMHHRDDASRDLTLTILVFEIPV